MDKGDCGIANSLLVEAKDAVGFIRPLKLQKLLYLLQGGYLEKHNGLIFSEPFQAWPYGPVLPTVYNAFKKNGGKHIKRLGKAEDGSVYQTKNETILEEIRVVVARYARRHDLQLMDLTHRNGGAWMKAYQERAGTELKTSDILEEFRSKAAS